jgi:hypothetical protein
MSLLPVVFLATVIYLILIIPLIVGVFAMYYVSKQLEVGDVTIGNTAKILGFYFFSGSLFFSVFAVFTIQPFSIFTEMNKNPYLNILVLLLLLFVLIVFVVIHFKTFFLFVKRFYKISLVKRIFFYFSATATVWFLVGFYFPAIRLFLLYSELAMSR